MRRTFLSILLSLALVFPALAQGTHSLSGKVTDSSGEPLIGAAVMVVGTDLAVITDFDGNYLIPSVTFPATIKISYIGYADTEIALTGKENLPYNIQIADSQNLLDEVVVVGFGTQKKSHLSGSVGVINGEKLNNRPVVSAANALQGADPSVYITTSNGSANSSTSINIRGTLSVNGGSPLVLVDGVESELSMVSPNDIESVSILKDASTCAIYGAKASAGVVLITTKQGKTGKANFSYSFRQGWMQPTTDMDFIDTGYDHISLINYFQSHSFHGSRVNEYNYTVDNGELLKLYERRNDKVEDPSRPWVEADADGVYHYYGNFDWFNQFYNTNRPTQEHNVSVSGGNDMVKYYVGGRFYSETGLLKGGADDQFRSYSIRSKIDAKVTKWLKYSNNISYAKKVYAFDGNSDMESTFQNLWRYGSPAFSPYNPDGTLVAEPYELGIAAVQFMMGKTPAQTLYGGNHNTKDRGDFTMTNSLNINPVKGLTITASHDYRRIDWYNTYRTNIYNYSSKVGQVTPMQGTTSSYKEDRNWRQVQIATGTIQYENIWGGHYFKALAGTQYEFSKLRELSVKASPILTEDHDTFALIDQSANDAGLPVAAYELGVDDQNYKTLGFFGRINYDYKGKYIAELSARYDGTSRFGENHRWGFFPSASVAWKFSEEKFFDPVRNWWDSGKLRLSAGSLGNQQVSSYYYVEKLSIDKTQDYTFDRNTKSRYAAVSAPVSADLTWETVTTYDAGLDLSFFNGRLNLVSDYYIRYTKDMLTDSVELPAVFGADAPKENCADLRTNGWEFSLTWRDSFNIAGHPFSYSINGFLGDRKTVFTKYYNPTGTLGDPYVGKEYGTIWGYRSGGLFGSDEEAYQYTHEVNCQKLQPGYYVAGGGVCVDGEGAKAGDFKLLDVNGDGELNNGANTLEDHGDLEIIGNTQPHYNYSFGLELSYFGFDISAFFQGIGHKDWFPGGEYGGYAFWGPYSSTSITFIHKDFMNNCWSETNPNAYFPRPRGYSAYTDSGYNYWTGLGKTNDYFLQNAGYLRFKNLTVGYTFPDKWTRKAAIQKLRIYFTGENLCYWSPLKDVCKIIDPELAGSSGQKGDGKFGVGYLYPRTLSFGVSVTF